MTACCICIAALRTLYTKHPTTPAPPPLAPPSRLKLAAPFPFDPAARLTQHVPAPQRLCTLPNSSLPPTHTEIHTPHHATACPTTRPRTIEPNLPPSPPSRPEPAQRDRSDPHANPAHQPCTHYCSPHLTRVARWNRPSPDTHHWVRWSLETQLETTRNNSKQLETPRLHHETTRNNSLPPRDICHINATHALYHRLAPPNRRKNES